MAETLTDKIKLSKRDTGDLNWGQGANANLDAIDAHAQQAILRPPRTLLATLGSGAVGANLLGSTTYFYKVTAVNAAGETTEGKIPATLEAQVTQPSTPLPVILQWETVKGATGYKIYKSTASGQEKFLASVSGEATSVYTDDGNTAVNGAISVPASNTARTSVSKIVAGTNITISPLDGTGDVTINSVGGGAAGYSTVVVAAPTGVAATDTANIQNAINSLPASGGSVILREGNYVLNGNITLPASKPLNFMGQGKSTRITLDPTFAPGAAPFRGPASGTLEKLVMSDFEYVGGSNQANFLFFSVPAATVWSNMVFERIKFLTCTTVISIGGSGTVKRVWIRDCEAIDCQALVESSTWSDSFILNNYIEKQAALAHPAGIDLGGTNIVCKGNTVVWPDSSNASNVPLRVASTFVKGSIEGNRCVGNRGLLVTLGANIRQSVVADNVFRENTFGTDSVLIQGEMSDSVVVGNHCEKDITLNGNAASGGNVIAGNKAASINDNSGATTPNIVARTLVSGVRKLGEANPLSGDVKLEAGSGIALTQDAPSNKITIAAAGGAGNWTLVANLTNTAFGQTFSPDFTGLSLNTHRSYMLMFELSLSSGGAGPNFVALRLNGAAPTTLQQYMLTDQQGVTQDDEGATNAMAKILKVFPGGGTSVEASGCIIITGKVNSGFPHAVGWYTVTNQSAVEQMHRGFVGLRMNLGSGVDLTSLGLFSNSDLNFLVAGSCRASLYQAQ